MATKIWQLSVTGQWVYTKTWLVDDDHIRSQFERAVRFYFKRSIDPERLLALPKNQKRGAYLDSGMYYLSDVKYVDTADQLSMYAKWVTDADGYGNLEVYAAPIQVTNDIGLPDGPEPAKTDAAGEEEADEPEEKTEPTTGPEEKTERTTKLEVSSDEEEDGCHECHCHY